MQPEDDVERSKTRVLWSRSTDYATKPFVYLLLLQNSEFTSIVGMQEKMAVALLKLKQLFFLLFNLFNCNPMFCNLCTRSSNKAIASAVFFLA